MDNLKILEQQIEQDIDPNGVAGSILAANHQAILKQVLAMVGKYTGSVFTARKNAVSFQAGTFSWNNNALNKTDDFIVTTSKKSADLNDIGIILETMVLGDVIQFKDYNGRSVFLVYQSHTGAEIGGNAVYQITVKGKADNPNYTYQANETAIAVLSYYKKLVDAAPAISNDAGNVAIIGSDGKIYVPASGGPSGTSNAIQNRYGTIAQLIAGQGNQTNQNIQYVNDASADPTVDSGFAYYEYLGTTNGDLTDYRKLTDSEVADITNTQISVQDINGVEQFKINDFVRFNNVVFDPATKTITPLGDGVGTTGTGVENRFTTIANLLANQSLQTDKGVQYVGDASADPTVDSGFAYYEYLGTTVGDLTDYRKMSESESMDLIQSAGAPPHENEFTTIATLLAGQGDQTIGFYQFVLDATTDSTVNSGWAIYQKLIATTGSLTDYRKIMEAESMDSPAGGISSDTNQMLTLGTDGKPFLNSQLFDDGGGIGGSVIPFNFYTNGTGYSGNVWSYYNHLGNIIRSGIDATFESLVTGINKQQTLTSPFAMKLKNVRIAGYSGPAPSPEEMIIVCYYCDLPIENGGAQTTNPVKAWEGNAGAFNFSAKGYNRFLLAGDCLLIPAGKAVFLGFQFPPDASNGQIQGMSFGGVFERVVEQ